MPFIWFAAPVAPVSVSAWFMVNEMNVATPAIIGSIHGSGWLRSSIHRNDSWKAKIMLLTSPIYLIGFLSSAKRPMMIGIWISIGRHPPIGLNFSSLYNSAIFMFRVSLSLAYFLCNACNLGCTSAIITVDFVCFMYKGYRHNLTITVNRIIVIP